MPLGQADGVSVQLGGDRAEGRLQVLARARVRELRADPLEPAIAGRDPGVRRQAPSQSVRQCRPADLYRRRGGRRPRLRGLRQSVPLSPLDVQVGEGDHVVEALDPLRADGRAGVAGEAHEGLHEGEAGGVGVDAVDQLAVQLHYVRPDPHHLPKAGVAGSRIIDRDQSAPLAQVGDQPREPVVLGDQLVLGDLDHQIGQVVGQRLRDRVGAERRGADVDREERPKRSPERRQRRADRRGLQLWAKAAAVRLGEPRLGITLRRAREAGERLVRDDLPSRQGDDGLEHRMDRLWPCEERRHPGVPLLAPADLHLLRVVAA